MYVTIARGPKFELVIGHWLGNNGKYLFTPTLKARLNKGVEIEPSYRIEINFAFTPLETEATKVNDA